MSQSPVIVRQEYLQRLQLFCVAFRDALSGAGLNPEASLVSVRSSVAAECVQCGIRISGEELLILAQPSAEKENSPKLERLRLGDCARKGCDSCYYRLMFHDHPQLHWPTILAQADKLQGGEPLVETPPTTSETPRAPALGRHLALARQFCIGVAVLALLLTARQWYRGGRIPLIREPEHFRVTPIAEEGAVE